MITHVLIRLKNGDEEVMPVQYLAASKMRSKDSDAYFCENSITKKSFRINAEQYDHLCCILKVEKI